MNTFWPTVSYLLCIYNVGSFFPICSFKTEQRNRYIRFVNLKMDLCFKITKVNKLRTKKAPHFNLSKQLITRVNIPEKLLLLAKEHLFVFRELYGEVQTFARFLTLPLPIHTAINSWNHNEIPHSYLPLKFFWEAKTVEVDRDFVADIRLSSQLKRPRKNWMALGDMRWPSNWTHELWTTSSNT